MRLDDIGESPSRSPIPATVDLLGYLGLPSSLSLIGLGTLTAVGLVCFRRFGMQLDPSVHILVHVAASLSWAGSATALLSEYRSLKQDLVDSTVALQDAAELVETLIRSTNEIDSTIARAIRAIQEIELVSRGYHITAPQLAPISRIEQSLPSKRCQLLREAIFSVCRAARVLWVDFQDSISALAVAQPSQQDLEALGHPRPGDQGTESSTNPFSLEELKAEHRALKSQRIAALQRLVCCRALAVETARQFPLSDTGATSDWLKICGALKALCSKTQDLSHALERVHSIETQIHAGPSSGQVETESGLAPSNHPRVHSFIQRLSSLGRHLQLMKVKLVVVSHDIKGHTPGSPVDQNMELFSTLSIDLANIQHELESARAALSDLSSEVPPGGRDNQTLDEEEPSPSWRLTLQRQTLVQVQRILDTHVDDTLHEEDLLFENVFESFDDDAVDADDGADSASKKEKLSRADRIALQRQARAKQEAQKEQKRAREQMVMELKNVLLRRPAKTPISNRPAQRERSERSDVTSSVAPVQQVTPSSGLRAEGLDGSAHGADVSSTHGSPILHPRAGSDQDPSQQRPTSSEYQDTYRSSLADMLAALRTGGTELRAIGSDDDDDNDTDMVGKDSENSGRATEIGDDGEKDYGPETTSGLAEPDQADESAPHEQMRGSRDQVYDPLTHGLPDHDASRPPAQSRVQESVRPPRRPGERLSTKERLSKALEFRRRVPGEPLDGDRSAASV
ncbi:uncharacterized protein BJ171DRAFT_118482 [Polychytrium aggregatum]|uniref:uncharacterized protein n=1 Tax=Polychytrium aggregatum TaxID=110093 RepID=UPI0022FF1BDD|nr:uncharacterized protein BJ171DRAFT_118482 [Polychytrium aggregatum]KAI9209485.1 hypothetical protein BJ171DRAFT_118482 [Polychytrium aggregatum]